MIAAHVVLALAGLASAFKGGSFFESAPINSLNGLRLDSTLNGLAARADQCLASEDVCGIQFCMPKGGRCCDRIKGTFCNPGYVCNAQGCCPVGKTCSGTPTSDCSVGKRICGAVCIPSSSTCCNGANSWCDYPKTCGTNGVCVSRTSFTTSPASEPSSTSIDAAATSPASQTDSSSANATGDSSRGGNNGNGGNNNDEDSKPPVGAIVGGVVGGIAALALIGVAIFFLLRHKKKQNNVNHDQTQNFQQQPPPHLQQSMPPMQQQYQQYPSQQPLYSPNASSPPQAMGYPPPHGSPPPQGYYNANAYSPSMTNEKVSSPTGTYSTDPRTDAPTLSPAPGFAAATPTPPPPPATGPGAPVSGAPQGPVHEMSTKPNDDHRGQFHELG